MSKFSKKKKRGTPGISTASLPDIVFMLLFFFMTVTVVKENPAKVLYTKPTTKFYDKIEDRNTIAYLYVGTDDKGNIRYEMNGQVYDKLTAFRDEIIANREAVSKKAKGKEPIYTLKIDKDNVDVRIVAKVRKALQDAEIQTILYSSDKRE